MTSELLPMRACGGVFRDVATESSRAGTARFATRMGAALWVFLAVPVLDPSRGVAQGVEPGQPAARSLIVADDHLLSAAAEAHSDILKVQELLQAELARFHDPQEQGAARERAMSRIAAALELHGLTDQQYEHVITVVGTDEARGRRFEELLERIRLRDESQTGSGAVGAPGL